MAIKIFVLLSMLFLHIIAEYNLQGYLEKRKCKTWYDDSVYYTIGLTKHQYYESKYRYDYLMALFLHSFRWTFMIMLPLTIHIVISGGMWYPLCYVTNTVVYMIVDNEKTNKHTLSLIQKQTIHLIQILSTWIAFVIL